MSRYETLVQTVRKKYPNLYKRHYIEHAESASLPQRINTANDLAIELRNHFIDQQPSGYKASQKPRTVYLPLKTTDKSTELLSDYVLAEDHVKGLKLQRDANEFEKASDEYPPLGEGAKEYFQRTCVAGAPLTIGEKRKVKECEVCRSKFIDRTKPGNAKVCGISCRERKEAIRKRKEYNVNVLGLADESRRKSQRARLSLEYGFYNPQEMNELATRSELAYDYEKLNRKAFKQSEDYAEWRINGKRKPRYVGRDEFSPKPFNYRPPDRYGIGNEKEWTSKGGEVIVRKLSEVSELQLESEKWLSLSGIKPCGARDKKGLGLEKIATI